MLLGEVISVVAEFIGLIVARDYEAAIGMCQRMDDPSAFRDGLTSLYGDILDNIGEMPPEAWKQVWVLGPTGNGLGKFVSVDAPVYDRSGEDMDWFFKFTLIPGVGEAWLIDYVDASN